MSEEQLVLGGCKLKILCAKRQSAAAEQSGIIIDTLRFTVPQRLLFEKDGPKSRACHQLLALRAAFLRGWMREARHSQ